MSTVTIPTRNFLGLLDDVALTASDDPDLPVLCSILLHSDRGEWTVQDDDPDDRASALIDVVYRHRQNKAVVIEVGSAYRGVLMPYRLDEEAGQHRDPQVRVFVPDLPERPAQDGDALLAGGTGVADQP